VGGLQQTQCEVWGFAAGTALFKNVNCPMQVLRL
jgi:hypothetical protein